jgi:hypothetical protein
MPIVTEGARALAVAKRSVSCRNAWSPSLFSSRRYAHRAVSSTRGVGLAFWNECFLTTLE